MEKDKPYLIGISGESGVGKSTIAEIVSLYFGIGETTILSTDDLHKWARNHPSWKEMTHLNPEANNLELGDMHLSYLSEGKFIYRSIYNHGTGYFDPPIKIEPKKNVIIEGLHSFYTELSNSLFNLKIFVDTDEDLRIHWKIIRDTEERGYTYNTALEAINKRKVDGEKIRKVQMEAADVIIKLVPTEKITHIGDKSEKINLIVQIENKKEKNEELFLYINHYINEFNKFVSASETIGKNINLCQNGGGNISVKLSSNHMLIKASGFNLKDVYRLNGYSIVNYQMFNEIDSEEKYNEILINSTISPKYKRPSMETGFHTLLYKYVIHNHPIYLTLLLCLSNSQEIINGLFKSLNFQHISYASPGFPLFVYMTETNSQIYFLDNHGIIISSDDMKSALDLLFEIENMAHKYLIWNHKIPNFDLSYADLEVKDEYTFPDAIIFAHDKSKKEIRAAHNYINEVGPKIGQLRYLHVMETWALKNSKLEEYRRTI